MKDYYSDYGHNFVKIFKNFELPDFVKEAEMIPEETLASMPDEAFANKVARRLPISSAADTYISTAYHLSCNDKDENVDQSLNKAASFWGITEEVEKLKVSLGSLEKSASEEEVLPSWSVDFTSSDNISVKTAGSSTNELAEACMAFIKMGFYLPFEDRVSVAKLFAGEFDKMGMEIPFEIGAMAEINFPNAEEVAQQLKSRAIRIFDNEKKAQLIKIADDLLNSSDRELEHYHEVAKIMDTLDKDNDLERFYGNPLKNAHEAVFNTPVKVAMGAIQTLKLPNGEYSIEDLKGIHQDVFKLALSEEDYKKVAEDFSKIATISEESKASLAEYL